MLNKEVIDKVKLLIGNALVIGYKKGHTGNIATEVAERATQKESEDVSKAIFDLLIVNDVPGECKQRVVEYVGPKKFYVQFFDWDLERWRPVTDKDGVGVFKTTLEEALQYIKDNPKVSDIIIHNV